MSRKRAQKKYESSEKMNLKNHTEKDKKLEEILKMEFSM